MKDKVLTIVFCLFIGVMMILYIALPKQTESVNEKRTLAKAPEVSLKSIADGSFEKGTEDYLSDHFPFRNEFVAVNAYYLLGTGRNGSSGIYRGKNGYLINTPVKNDKGYLEENMTAIIDFAKKTQIPAAMAVIPSVGYIMDEELPLNHLQYNDGVLLGDAWKMSDGSLTWIDVCSMFNEAKNEFQLYYKTDHHWTSEGAYLVYCELAKQYGFEPMWDFNIETYDGFYGTSYSKSALWGEKGDSLQIWNYDNSVSVDIDGNVSDSMFYREHLDRMDKYPVFLNGNQPFERITNPNAETNNKLLVIKDSYAHCLVPFLAQHFSQIDMVDLRYYFDPVSNLTSENQYDNMLMLYGLSSLCESNDISILQ